MDIRMPVLDGIAATTLLAGPGVPDPIPVVVITTFDLDEYVYAALRAGARGFLLKNAGAVLLAEAVHAAARGDALIDPNVTVRLIEAFAPATRAAVAEPASPLTDREQDGARGSRSRSRQHGDRQRTAHLAQHGQDAHREPHAEARRAQPRRARDLGARAPSALIRESRIAPASSPRLAGAAAPRLIGVLSGFLSGVALLLRGFGVWRRNPGVMLLGLVPAFIVFVLIVGALVALGFSLAPFIEWATPFADSWTESWATALRLTLGAITLGAAGLLAAVTFTALTLAIGDPFYERIWRAVELDLGGEVPDRGAGVWQAVRDSTRPHRARRRLVARRAVVGFIPVVGAVAAPVLGVVLSGRLLARELTSRAFEARGLTPDERRAVLRPHRARMLGFGVATQLLFLIPLGAVFTMPAAVAGSTMLARAALDGAPAHSARKQDEPPDTSLRDAIGRLILFRGQVASAARPPEPGERMPSRRSRRRGRRRARRRRRPPTRPRTGRRCGRRPRAG